MREIEQTKRGSKPEAGTVTVAGKGIKDRGGGDDVITGTRHIIDDGEPLCGHYKVKGQLKTGNYAVKESENPLNSHDLCETCGKKYLREYLDDEELLIRVATFEYGDWVVLTTEDGEQITGRVRHTADEDSFRRRVRILLSDNVPMERAHSPTDEMGTLKVREGEQPLLVEGAVVDDDRPTTALTDVERIEPPQNNIDQRTAATLKELKTIVGDDGRKVMAIGSDIHKFLIIANSTLTTTDVEALVERVEDNGYDVIERESGDERESASSTRLIVRADPLVDLSGEE